MFDHSATSLPPLGLLRRYLLDNRWKRSSLRDGALELFTLGPDNKQSPEIVLGDSDPEDARRRISQALRTLSSVTGKSVNRVASDISMYDFDLLRAILPDSLVIRESIHLRVAERFIVNARRFLTSAAAAEVRKSLVVADNQSAGGEYANSCRLGHTFKGSFGFAIESPAGPAAKTLDGDEPPAPVERRIVERIARGLAVVEEATFSRSVEPLLVGAEQGFNFNMLSDFTTWVAETNASKIQFDITLTPAWPRHSDIRLSAEIVQDALPILDDAISILKPLAGPVLVTVVGQVFRLETREIPASLLEEGRYEIGLEGISAENGPIVLRIRLSSEDYLLAVDAHRNGRFISVTGEIGRVSRAATMLHPTAFRVL